MTTLGLPFLGVKEGFPGSNMLQSSVKTAYSSSNRYQLTESTRCNGSSSYTEIPRRFRWIGLLRPYLLHDAALVGASGEGLKVDDALDVGLHVADHLELDIGLEEGARDLVEAVVEHFLVDHRGVAHLRQGAGDAPAQLREHHLAGLGVLRSRFR